MTIEFKKWQKIQQFHNIKKTIDKAVDYKRTVGEDVTYPVVTYRAKVKLDGTNAAIRIVDGEVVAQSRGRLITPEDDNYGFAAFVEANKEWASSISPSWDITVYGEWCGKGVQKRCSVSKCERMFVVFCIVQVEDGADVYYNQPKIIEHFLNRFSKAPSNVYTLPWYTSENDYSLITVDYGSRESIDAAVNKMCAQVAEVENCDPWVKEVFGHEGIGEGLVYTAYGETSREILGDGAMFKAKGEKHQNVIQLKPVISDPEKVASVDSFVAKFVTDNRLEQGLVELGITNPSTKDTGKFLKWLGNDVRSESEDELESSDLDWKDVSKKVGTVARNWFFERV